MDFKDIVELLQSKQYKLTPQRIAIIKMLLDISRPLSAQEAYSYLKIQHSSMSLDTVYRSFNLLCQLGVVSKINIANRERELFELAQHHHHLVCLKCSKVICMEKCLLDLDHNHRVYQLAHYNNFQITNHVFEVYGYCSSCRTVN